MDERFNASPVYQWCCVRTEMQPILPALLLVLFGFVIWIDYAAGGLGKDRNTFILSYNISFYLADSFWTILIGMFAMALLFMPYSVRVVRAMGRSGPDDMCFQCFFQVVSVLIAVGFLLVGVFYSDVSFQNGRLHWDPKGGWRLPLHGLGACLAFYGIAMFGLVAVTKLYQISARVGYDRNCALFFCDGNSVLVPCFLLCNSQPSCVECRRG